MNLTKASYSIALVDHVSFKIRRDVFTTYVDYIVTELILASVS